MTRARDIADIQDNLGGAVAPVTAGKNAVINGAFDFWQRGTSFAASNSAYIYTADRWLFVGGGFTTGKTLSRQASGLTGFNYCARIQRDSGNTSTQPLYLHYTAETADSLRFAGQVVTLSFYARAGANYSGSNTLGLVVATGTGNDQSVQSFTGNTNVYSSNYTISTTWQRFTATMTFGSTTTEFGFYFISGASGTAGAADFCEIAGVQFEAGSQATPFARAGGSIGGELALCQRYYYRAVTGGSAFGRFGQGVFASGTVGYCEVQLPVTMRTVPSTTIESGGTLGLYDGAADITITSITGTSGCFTANMVLLTCSVASGGTQYRICQLEAKNDSTAYVGFTAEL